MRGYNPTTKLYFAMRGQIFFLEGLQEENLAYHFLNLQKKNAIILRSFERNAIEVMNDLQSAGLGRPSQFIAKNWHQPEKHEVYSLEIGRNNFVKYNSLLGMFLLKKEAEPCK
jgi:hypothetical protein